MYLNLILESTLHVLRTAEEEVRVLQIHAKVISQTILTVFSFENFCFQVSFAKTIESCSRSIIQFYQLINVSFFDLLTVYISLWSIFLIFRDPLAATGTGHIQEYWY